MSGKKKERNEVVQILMDRDGLTEEEAIQAVEDCRSELWDSFYGTNILTPDEIIEEELGLEADYIFDIMG